MTETADWGGWLLYMLAAVEETARWTTGRITEIRELFEATTERCRRELERIGILQREKRGREVLYRHPALLEALKA